MADDDRTISRTVKIIFDRGSAEQVEKQLEAAFADAGERGGKAFLRELRQEFALQEAKLKEQLARGVIDEKEFKKRSEAAAKAFNTALLNSMDKARQAGNLTDKEYVKLTRTLKRVGTEGDTSGNLITRSFMRARGAIVAALAAFGARAIFRGARDMVREASEAETVWNRLAGTLDNVGVAFDQVEESLRNNALQLQRTTRVSDEEYADVLQTLISISGDYQKSLENVGLVADLAAAKKIDLATAATLVGKVMAGETGTLKRYGIVVQEGADALQAMRDRFGGAAVNELETYSGKVEQLGNLWGEVKEEIGGAIIRIIEATGVLNLLTTAVSRAVENIRRLRETDAETRERQRDPLLEDEWEELRRESGFDLGPRGETAEGRTARLEREADERNRKAEEAAKKREQARDKEIRDLLALHEFHMLTNKERQRALEIEKELGREVLRTQEQRIKNQERFNAIRVIGDAERTRINLGVETGRTAGTQTTGLADIGTIPLDPIRLAGDEHVKQAQRSREAWETAFDIIAQEQEIAVGLIAGLGQAFAEGGLRGLARYAGAKVRENIAEAIEAAARALVALANPLTAPRAPIYAAGSAKHLAAAGLWRVFGGVAGGGGSGSTSGGAPSVGTANTRTAATAQPGAEIHIHFVGPGFDAANPQVQRVVQGAIKNATERQGNAHVYTHRRRS